MTRAGRRKVSTRGALRVRGRPDAADPEHRLTATLRDQQAEEAARLDAIIAANLRELGYGE